MTGKVGQVPERRREMRRAKEVAEEYQRKGYEVFLGPGPDLLPVFLSDFRPDLLARVPEGGESVAVKVESRASLCRPSRLAKLARAVEGHPGWRFELVLTNPTEGASVEPDEERLPYTKRDATRAIAEAEELVRSDRPEAALLLAWSAVEAILRLLIAVEGLSLSRFDPPYMLKQLAVEAAISREDYDLLMRAARRRNVVAHGFKAEEGVNLVNLVLALLETANRLLRNLPRDRHDTSRVDP